VEFLDQLNDCQLVKKKLCSMALVGCNIPNIFINRVSTYYKIQFMYFNKFTSEVTKADLEISLFIDKITYEILS